MLTDFAIRNTKPGELSFAKWKEFDLDAAEWSIAAEHTEMRPPHRVPIWRRAQRPQGGVSS